MKNAKQLSFLRSLIVSRVYSKSKFNSFELAETLRKEFKSSGSNVHQKSVMISLLDIFNQGLISDYYIDEINVETNYISFSPSPNQQLVRTMPQDKLGRVTVPKPILTSLGVNAYGTVYVTREPSRVLLSSFPLGSDSTELGTDCYANTKLHLPKVSDEASWTARTLNSRIVEVLPAI